jgi:uncharacterized protein (DUF4415 family)
MSNTSTSPTRDDRDEYPEITQADLDRATFRVGLKPAPRKQRVTIMLDTALIEYFRARSGARGYQTLINDTLRETVARDDLEAALRRIVREELQREREAART